MRSMHPATAVALLIGLLGCDAAPPTAPRIVHLLVGQGLEQTVQLTPAQPASGDQLTIVSVVTNHAADSVAVTSRICGLDLAGDLALATTGVACAGYSMNGPLAPGGSLTASDVRVVVSPPGQFTLRVRHLLVPDAWVEIPVVVR